MSIFGQIFLFIFLQKSVTATSYNRFPDDFKFGVSSSAYQIEGAWNASGKSENIWDIYIHEHRDKIADDETADIACDSYNLWRTDVKLLKDLGVDHYRFSIAWTRILPSGFVNEINQDGVKYYNDLIDSLLQYGIEPIVTLFHFDLPQTLQDLGGWTNLNTATYFADYARVVFRLFGDRVKTWTTINEPATTCLYPYEYFFAAPAIHNSTPGIGPYQCGRSILVAHAKAYHIYDNEFRRTQKGKIGIAIESFWHEPSSNKTEDVEAAERELQMTFGWWAHPIFSKDGDYPQVMKSRIAERSLREGFRESRLPSLTTQEIENLRGSADFLGLNHYLTWSTGNKEYPIGAPSYQSDKGTYLIDMEAFRGLYKLLKYISKEYGNPSIIITENGFFDNGQLEDIERIQFYRGALGALLEAVNEGVNVKQYTAWSLLDSFEWVNGYTQKYGFYHVDFNSSNRTRTPKASSCFYKKVIQSKQIPDEYDIFKSSDEC